MATATYSFKGTADMSQHNQQIEGAKKEIKKYEDEVIKAQKETSKLGNPNFSKAYSSQKQLQATVKNTTNVLNGLQGNMMGAIAKFGPYAAAAAAAIGVAFKGAQRAMKESDEMTDKFRGTMEGLDAATGRFAYQIATLDFTGLISNLQTAWNAAKNLYDAMDALGTFNVINDDKIKQIEMELEALRTRGRQGEDVTKLVKQKEAELEQALKDGIPRIQTAKEAAMAAALNWSDIYNNKGWGTDKGSMEKLWDRMIGYKLLDSGELERRIKDTQKKIDQLTKGTSNASPVRNSAAYVALQKELHALQLATKVTDDQIKAVNEQKQSIREINNKLNRTIRMDLKYTDHTPKGGSKNGKSDKPDPLEGSIAYIDKQIKDLKDRLNNEVLEIPARVKIENEIKDLEAQKAMIDLKVAINGNTNLTKAFGSLLDDMLQADTVDKFCEELVDLIDKSLKANTITPEYILPSKEMEEMAKDAMKNINKIIDEEYKKICEEIRSSNQDIADSFSAVGSVFSSFGTMMGEEAGKWVSTFGEILSTVGEVIAKLVSLAAANGVASAFELPFPANLAAVATVLAGIASAVSAISSYSNQTFASGGIFEGDGSRIGDMHLARVNPGEMILNDREQANLFRMLNNGIGEQQGGGIVTFRISGSDLIGVLNNYDKATKRVR